MLWHMLPNFKLGYTFVTFEVLNFIIHAKQLVFWHVFILLYLNDKVQKVNYKCVCKYIYVDRHGN